jgi:hypothetical protein
MHTSPPELLFMNVVQRKMEACVTSKSLPDNQFVVALESCELPNESFHHSDHVRLAWIYLRSMPESRARERMASTLRRFAAHNGKSERYHHTRTLAWMRLVSAAIQATPAIDSFEEFLEAHPHLSNQLTLLQHYSKDCLESQASRAGWVAPDLQSLPSAE